MYSLDLLIDFDCNFITRESLEEISRVSLKTHPKKSNLIGLFFSTTKISIIEPLTEKSDLFLTIAVR